jgi:hypothetical protein
MRPEIIHLAPSHIELSVRPHTRKKGEKINLKGKLVCVYAKIECNNKFNINDVYLDDNHFSWISASKTCLISITAYCNEFKFPKEVVSVGNAYREF